MAEPKIVMMRVAKLVPYAKNARTHSDEQVSQIINSITEFGFNNPVLVDNKGGIIAGHGRVMAASKMGLMKVPCIVLGHLSERQKQAYILADNKIAMNSGWDFEMLASEISELSDHDFDIMKIGFDEQELDALLKDDVSILPAGAMEKETIEVSAYVRNAASEQKPSKAEIDMVSLLTKYMSYLKDVTGSDYVLSRESRHESEIVFSSDEWNLLTAYASSL